MLSRSTIDTFRSTLRPVAGPVTHLRPRSNVFNAMIARRPR